LKSKGTIRVKTIEASVAASLQKVYKRTTIQKKISVRVPIIKLSKPKPRYKAYLGIGLLSILRGS